MVKLIIGLKGTGKTKTLIGMVNSSVDTTDGAVVCLEKGDKLRYDIKYQARLIDVDEYGIDDGQALYGFVTGIYASNSDITHIFIDSAIKCANGIWIHSRLLSERRRLLLKNGMSML